MESKLAVLPCNGLDKCAGCVSHEVALRLAESAGAEIICPVLLREADARYKRLADELPLVVVDGCATRCASKLAAEKGLKAALKSNVAQEAKDAGLELPAALRLDEATEGFARDLAKGILDELEAMDSTGDNSESEGDAAGAILPADISYETFTVGEVEFRLPANDGFLFSENDAWVFFKDGKAVVGITDFAQRNLGEIMFFDPPATGAEIGQFDEVGVIESGKAVYEVVCPVSGTVAAVNEALTGEPETINENPYELGWLAALDAADFEEDKDLLMSAEDYLPAMKRKAEEALQV